MRRAGLWIFLLCMAATSWSCRDPYRDVKLEIAWGDALRRDHAAYVKCASNRFEPYFQLLAAEILEHVEYNPYTFRFCLTNELDVNAYALPGGAIYVHRGLINAAPSESALVYVLAHEMSHVLLRHSFRMERKRRASKELARRLPGRGMAAPARLFGTAGLLRFSRRFEKDADLKAMSLAARAGYDPRGALEFLEKLREMEYGRSGLLARMFSTHPRPRTRLRYVRRRLARMQLSEYYREQSSDYLALKKFARPRARKAVKRRVR